MVMSMNGCCVVGLGRHSYDNKIRGAREAALSHGIERWTMLVKLFGMGVLVRRALFLLLSALSSVNAIG